MRPFVHRDVLVEMWEESDNLEHYLMTEDGGSRFVRSGVVNLARVGLISR